MMGLVYWQRGLFRETEPLLKEAIETGRQAGNYVVAASSLCLLAYMDIAGGKLHRAAGQIKQAIELAGPSTVATPSHLSLSSLFYEWNDLESALYHVQQAIELAQILGGQGLLARLYCLLARISLARDDDAGATKALEKACLIAHNISDPGTRAEHATFHIELALRRQDLVTASEWGSQLAEDAGTLPYYCRDTLPRLLIAQGKKSEAMEKLQALYEETMQGGAQSSIIRILMYQTLVAGTQESALKFLANTMAMVEPEGYIRIFVDEGKLLAPLLRKAVAQGIMPGYAGKLLNIIESEKQRMAVSGEKSNPSPISERELEVLKLVADGLTNQQIADKLIISLSTAKSHVYHIFDKLNAKGRLQAVTRAREL